MARRQAILDAARLLFLERGYDGISMSDVVERAGGSLATVYACFGSKEGLFDAILDELSAEIAAPLLELDIDRRSPREALQRVGESFLTRILRADALAWYRMCVTEGPSHPGLRAALFRAGPGRLRDRLGRYLEAQARAGRLRIEHGPLAAAQFLSLVKAAIHMEAICGEPIASDARSIRAHVSKAVELFLNGCSS